MNFQEGLQMGGKAIRSSVPLATLLFGVLLGATPLGIPGLARVAPFYALAILYFWTLHRPNLVPRLLVFGVGLVQDATLGTPLGLSVVALLLAQAFALEQRMFLARKSFWISWLGLGVTACGACAAGWLIASIYEATLLPLAPALLQAVVTILIYPALASLLAKLQSRVLTVP